MLSLQKDSVMRAIEFKSRIKNNQIQIPAGIQAELITNPDKDIRVIVFVDDSDIYDNIQFQSMAAEQFLKGYSESDSVYDEL
jgi:hypothetical protein